jgi:hypothetical protein
MGGLCLDCLCYVSNIPLQILTGLVKPGQVSLAFFYFAPIGEALRTVNTPYIKCSIFTCSFAYA